MHNAALFEGVMAAMPGLVGIYNEDGELVYWNQQFESLTGLSSTELDHQNFLSLFRPEDHDEIERELAVIDQGVTRRVEYDIKLKGEFKPFVINISSKDLAGETFYLAVALDISDRKSIEDSLQETRRRHAEAQQIANLGHWELDHASGDLVWSDEVYRIFELDPDTTEPDYDLFLKTIHPDDRSLVDQVFSHSVAEREGYELVHRLKFEDDRVKYVQEQGQTYYNDDGSPQRSVGTVLDVTERREADNELRRKNSELNRALFGIVDSLAKALESRDAYTAGHQSRVSSIAGAIAKKLGLDASQIEGLVLGAKVHDIGKLSIPVELLTKPTRLTDMEFALIKSHPEIGAEILADVIFPWPIAEIVVQHHERLDGSGYPKGLKGDEICQEARIVAVADVYEAMSSNRPYRAALGDEIAIEELKRNRGKFYDPEAVDALLELIEEADPSLALQ